MSNALGGWGWGGVGEYSSDTAYLIFFVYRELSSVFKGACVHSFPCTAATAKIIVSFRLNI